MMIGLFIFIAACSSTKTNDNGNNAVTGSNNAASNTVTSKANHIQSITSIKTAQNLNKTFTVEGMVVSNVRTGSISGYRLKNGNDSIPISSRNIPPINSTVTVTGILHTSSYFGYYLSAIDQ